MSERVQETNGGEEHRLARMLDTVPARVAVPALPGALSLVAPLAERTYPSPELLARIDAGLPEPSPITAVLRALDKEVEEGEDKDSAPESAQNKTGD